jgi:O-antigen/teichoic acid export membrane protein
LAEQLGIRTILSLVAAVMVLAVVVVLRYPPAVLRCAAVASLGILLGALTTTLSDLLQGLHRMSTYALANFVGGLCLTTLSVVVIWFGGGPVALAAAYLVGPAVSAIILVAFIRRNLFPVGAHWSLHNGWRHLKNSRFFAAQQFINTLNANFESLLLPKIVASSVFGVYSAGLLLASRLVIIPDSLASVFYPVIANAWALDKKSAGREVARFLMLALLVCLPITIVVLFLSGPVSHVLFPRGAVLCQQVICITIWSIPLLGVENVMGYTLNATGHDAHQAGFNLCTALVSSAIAVFLVLHWGLLGACVSFTIRTVVKIAFITPLFLRTSRPSLPVNRLAKLAICLVAMAAVMWFGKALLPARYLMQDHPAAWHGWLMLMAGWSIYATIGLIVYGSALLATGILSPADLRQLLQYRRKGHAA